METAYAALGLFAAGGFVAIRAIGWWWNRKADNTIARNANTERALEAMEFEATYGVISVDGNVAVAVNEVAFIGICEIDSRGTVTATHFDRLPKIKIETLEDTKTGRLVLRVESREVTYDVLLARDVPTLDGKPNTSDYERRRAMLAWWKTTLSGDTPDGPYPLAPLLAPYAFGSATLEIALACYRELGVTGLPDARVVKTT